jgi:hypothetical protein
VRTFKSVFGVIAAIGPVIYCAGLVYYFYDQAGSMQQANDMGLSPVLIGMGVVGLLFCIPLLYRIIRLITGRRTSGSDGQDGPSASPPDDKGGFDADAVIARYMARQPAPAVPSPSAAPSRRDGGSPARRPGFGRKVR